MHRMLTPLLTCLIPATALFAAKPATAQRLETTGSHLGSSISGRMITRFSEPQELNQILELLENGKTEEGLALAEDYLESLDSVIHVGASSAVQERYLALNAYCVALTHSQRYDDAVAACSEAIELIPGRWSSLNNRGTAYLMLNRFDAAIDDYRNAREHTSDEDIIEMIEFNIDLVGTRRSAAAGDS